LNVKIFDETFGIEKMMLEIRIKNRIRMKMKSKNKKGREKRGCKPQNLIFSV